jgi:hypothetical protein
MNLSLPNNCLAVFIDDTGNELLKDPMQKVFGLGGCAIIASQLDTVIRKPWAEVRRLVGGSVDASLHASEIREPTAAQISAISEFFKTQPFSRFGSICSHKTDLDRDISPLVLVARCLGNRIADILRWQPISSVAIILEHSERLSPKLEEVFSDFNLTEDGRKIPIDFYWMAKTAREPALEVADFIANATGTEVRHRMAGKPDYAKNFKAFFHHCDPRLMSFIDIGKVQLRHVGPAD